MENQDKIERLVAENERLKAELDTYKKIWSDKEVHIALTDVRTGERKLWYENCLKYKTCLQEIKAIAEELLEKGLEPQSVEHQLRLKGKRELASIISDLITKAEEE
jgi:hypothetical protein